MMKSQSDTEAKRITELLKAKMSECEFLKTELSK